jgi:hypothetical protein
MLNLHNDGDIRDCTFPHHLVKKFERINPENNFCSVSSSRTLDKLFPINEGTKRGLILPLFRETKKKFSNYRELMP